MNDKAFWISSLVYVVVTVFISTAISEEFFRFNLGSFKIDDMATEYKIGYALLKIGIAIGYLRWVEFDWVSIVSIILMGLFVRYLKGPFTMGIVGPAIALYLKDSLIYVKKN